MAPRVNICVGTVGQGVWHSPDGGEHWKRVAEGIHFETEVRALAVHPERPEVIFAGTSSGLYRSENGGASWQWVENLPTGYPIWALAIHPRDPNVMFAGSRPSALFRSVDGGRRWQQLSVELAEECVAVRIPRVTGIAIDPAQPQTIWAGIEVDGLRCSRDGGETWETVDYGVNNPDVHGVTVGAGPGVPRRVWMTVNDDVLSSSDNGATWQAVNARKQFPVNYCRGILVQPENPDTIFVGVGDYTPGSTGVIERSKDGGKTWETLSLPVEPNTAIWCLAAHPADPKFILAASLYGYLYYSTDGGDSWAKFPREFSEVRALVWAPA